MPISAPRSASSASAFPGEYWRQLDREMAYPAEFVAALTEAGFLASLIPEEYGGAGLTLTAAAAVLEEIQHAGCNGGACHAQMYIMGTLLRHGSAAQKTALSAGHRLGRAAAAGLRRHRADQRHRHQLDPHHRPARGRSLCRQWPEDLDQPRRAIGPDAAPGAHHADAIRRPSAPTGSRSSSSTCARPRTPG